jgi:hypothetical protein
VTAFREIRGLRQPAAHEQRRWFQSPFFDHSGALVPDGLLPYLEVIEKFEGDAEVARAPALP